MTAAKTADAYDPTTYHPDDVAAGNTPTDAERAADRDAPAFVQYVSDAAESDRLRTLWAKLDAESGYVR